MGCPQDTGSFDCCCQSVLQVAPFAPVGFSCSNTRNLSLEPLVLMQLVQGMRDAVVPSPRAPLQFHIDDVRFLCCQTLFGKILRAVDYVYSKFDVIFLYKLQCSS